MTQRFLAFLLFGVLAFAAFDGFGLRAERRENATRSATSVSAPASSPEVTAMHGGNPWPPPPL
jgi:hypothetical protein